MIFYSCLLLNTNLTYLSLFSRYRQRKLFKVKAVLATSGGRRATLTRV